MPRRRKSGGSYGGNSHSGGDSGSDGDDVFDAEAKGLPVDIRVRNAPVVALRLQPTDGTFGGSQHPSVSSTKASARPGPTYTPPSTAKSSVGGGLRWDGVGTPGSAGITPGSGGVTPHTERSTDSWSVKIPSSTRGGAVSGGGTSGAIVPGRTVSPDHHAFGRSDGDGNVLSPGGFDVDMRSPASGAPKLTRKVSAEFSQLLALLPRGAHDPPSDSHTVSPHTAPRSVGKHLTPLPGVGIDHSRSRVGGDGGGRDGTTGGVKVQGDRVFRTGLGYAGEVVGFDKKIHVERDHHGPPK